MRRKSPPRKSSAPAPSKRTSPKRSRSPAKKSRAKRPSKKLSVRAQPEPRTPHIAWFSFQTPGKPPRRGSFQILLDAQNVEQALARCRARLSAISNETRLFSAKTTVYLEGVLELRGPYEHGVLVNFESLEQPEIDVRLTCLIPEQTGHGVVGHGPTIEEADAVEPFLELGPVGGDGTVGRKPRQSSRPPITVRSPAEAS